MALGAGCNLCSLRDTPSVNVEEEMISANLLFSRAPMRPLYQIALEDLAVTLDAALALLKVELVAVRNRDDLLDDADDVCFVSGISSSVFFGNSGRGLTFEL